jgi:hypothetical protein
VIISGQPADQPDIERAGWPGDAFLGQQTIAGPPRVAKTTNNRE